MTRIADRKLQTEISEVFSSLQGEGPYLGVKQIFVRFGRCNMHCGYCDELEKMKEERFDVVSLGNLLDQIEKMEKKDGPHHSISLTGGEPLFYAAFLEGLLPKLKERGMTTYLETNGTLPNELKRVIKWCDVIAMDLKPASSTGDRDFTKEHEKFLKIAIQKETFIKVVVTPDTKLDDVRKCVVLVAAVNPNLPFIFQPLTDPFGISQGAMNKIEKEFFPLAKEVLSDVRVIPQLHKIWGVR